MNIKTVTVTCPKCQAKREIKEGSYNYGKKWGKLFLCRKCSVYKRKTADFIISELNN